MMMRAHFVRLTQHLLHAAHVPLVYAAAEWLRSECVMLLRATAYIMTASYRKGVVLIPPAWAITRDDSALLVVNVANSPARTRVDTNSSASNNPTQYLDEAPCQTTQPVELTSQYQQARRIHGTCAHTWWS